VTTQSFQGELVTVPFGAESLHEVVIDEYGSLINEHDSEDVVVLTGSPTSMETFREVLDSEVPGAGVPRVTSPVVQATDVVNKTDDRAILSDVLRRELLHRFLEDREWDNNYLRRASEHSSFIDHVSGVMETVAWQDVSLDETPELVEISEATDEFHAWLDEKEHIERGQLISEATSVLENEGYELEAEAVFVVEFEEFFPADRRYLAALSESLDLVCVAEKNSSVRRTLVETGSISEHVSFTKKREAGENESGTRPSATAKYISTGEVHRTPSDGEVTVLEADTMDEQVEMVADEIERLQRHEDLSYDDIAVALKNSADVSDTLEGLHRAGLPTESTTVTGFGDDPAVRELLRFVRYLAGEDLDIGEDPVLEEDLLERIEENGSLTGTLRRWATESNLKTRVAERTPPLDARAQFGNVRRVFQMTEFVEDTDFIDATWEDVAEMIERSHGYAPQQNQTSATELDGGVRVDHVRSIKNGEFRVVFLLDVVDPQYPGEPHLTPLFPTERVSDMSDYPGVSQVEETDVERTFTTSSSRSVRPFRAYHTEHARRTLAAGADTATDRLYFCLYDHEGTALENRVQPSRFLVEMCRNLSWMEETGDPIIRSERAAEQYLLSRVDDALGDVRRANAQDVEVSLGELEKELIEVNRLLDRSGERGKELREALRARIDFAEGKVRRD
jgi:hypothetical protein